MSSTRRDLEEELVRRPADLTLHLAYSDLLTDLGDPRGEFIRLQIHLEDAALTAELKAQYEVEVAALLKAHESEWLGRLAKPLRVCGRATWKRGWVSGLLLRRVTLDLIEAVPLSPVIRLLTRVSFRPPIVSDSDLVLLLTAPWLRRINTLELSHCGITDDGAIFLANHPVIRAMKRLRLDGNLLSPIGIEALREVGHTNIGRQRYGGSDRFEI